MVYFTELEQVFQKFIQNPKMPSAILRKKNKAGEITILYIELYYKAIVIKTAGYCHKKKKTHRSMEQNRGPRNKPTPLFNRGSEHIQWTRNSLFNK